MGAIDASYERARRKHQDWSTSLEGYRSASGRLRSFQRDHYETAPDDAYDQIQRRFDELAGAYDGALRSLLFLEAPCLSAAALKARIAAEEKVCELVIGDAVARAIADDLERLTRR